MYLCKNSARITFIIWTNSAIGVYLLFYLWLLITRSLSYTTERTIYKYMQYITMSQDMYNNKKKHYDIHYIKIKRYRYFRCDTDIIITKTNHCPLYACTNKYVLSDFLKEQNVVWFLILLGKRFHNLGPTTLKALSP